MVANISTCFIRFSSKYRKLFGMNGRWNSLIDKF